MGKFDEFFGFFIGGWLDMEVFMEIEDRFLVDDIFGVIVFFEELKKE